MNLNAEVIRIISLAIVCGIAAVVLMNMFKRFLQSRRPGESLQEFVNRASEEHLMDEEAKQREAAHKFGTWGQTMQVHMLNFALMLGTVSLAPVSVNLLNSVGVYVIVGILVLKRAGIPSADQLAGLAWSDRLWLRIYYAWFWPLYLMARK